MMACKAYVLVAATCHFTVLCFAASPVQTSELARPIAGSRDTAVPGQAVQITPTHRRSELPFQQAALVSQAGVAQGGVLRFDEVGGNTAILKCTVDPTVGAAANIVRAGNRRGCHLSLSDQMGRMGHLARVAPLPLPSWSNLIKKD